jgi:hypothetical protein
VNAATVMVTPTTVTPTMVTPVMVTPAAVTRVMVTPAAVTRRRSTPMAPPWGDGHAGGVRADHARVAHVSNVEQREEEGSVMATTNDQSEGAVGIARVTSINAGSLRQTGLAARPIRAGCRR